MIKNLNVDKTHGWEDISIRIIKVCGKSIVLLLRLIFQFILNDDIFSRRLEKNNIVTLQKERKAKLNQNQKLSTNKPSSNV